MKSKIFAFIALIAATLSLSSCLNSDEETVEYTHDTAITAFSLGSLDRYTKTTAGKDTLLKANVTGSSYKFYIDQVQHLIYNVDSLPCGVRDSAVLATITSKNSSPILLMDIEKTDSITGYYSSSDSINFSKPRFLRVYNNDLSAYATYKVTVNVHQEQPDEFKWHARTWLDQKLVKLSDLKALAVNDYIYVFGKTEEGMKVYKSAIVDGSNWTELTLNVDFGADDFQNAVAMGDNIYMLSQGKLYASADGENWTEKGEKSSLVQLIGASTQNLYAYEGSEVESTQKTSQKAITNILVSKDQGSTWTAEALDADAEFLPTHNVTMNVSVILSTKDAEHLMLLGTRDDVASDTIAATWHRTVDYAANASEGEWNYQEMDKNQPGKMPKLSEVLTSTASTGYVALGSNGKWYKSLDMGLTWSEDTLVTMPAEFASSARFALCRDKQNFYWVIRNGYVWKGRFNCDGWLKE